MLPNSSLLQNKVINWSLADDILRREILVGVNTDLLSGRWRDYLYRLSTNITWWKKVLNQLYCLRTLEIMLWDFYGVHMGENVSNRKVSSLHKAG